MQRHDDGSVTLTFEEWLSVVAMLAYIEGAASMTNPCLVQDAVDRALRTKPDARECLERLRTGKMPAAPGEASEGSG